MTSNAEQSSSRVSIGATIETSSSERQFTSIPYTEVGTTRAGSNQESSLPISTDFINQTSSGEQQTTLIRSTEVGTATASNDEQNTSLLFSDISTAMSTSFGESLLQTSSGEQSTTLFSSSEVGTGTATNNQLVTSDSLTHISISASNNLDETSLVTSSDVQVATSILSSLFESHLSTNSPSTVSLPFDDTSTEQQTLFFTSVHSSLEASTDLPLTERQTITVSSSEVSTLSELSTQSSNNGPSGLINPLVTDSTTGFSSGEGIITSSMFTMLETVQSSDAKQTTLIETYTQSGTSNLSRS